MRKVMFMALMMVGTVVFAQRQNVDPKAIAAKRSEKMKTELSLSNEQFEKVKAINDKFADEQIQTKADKPNQSREEARTALKKRDEERMAAFKEVLTPEQFEKWKKIRAEQAKKARGTARRRS